MNDERETSEKPDEHGPSDEKPVATTPRGTGGESRVVAERSGADTSFPERPILADPPEAEARRTERMDEEPGEGEPEPEMGPAS
ncbi:hypothetical protein [Streptosporangium sp. NPDC000396]|uniref:hypothetical protein n=1 Tax=Streptosporangium sp. NPDC000396 TaxID=3366185 RepID=UPI00369B8002